MKSKTRSAVFHTKTKKQMRKPGEIVHRYGRITGVVFSDLRLWERIYTVMYTPLSKKKI